MHINSKNFRILDYLFYYSNKFLHISNIYISTLITKLKFLLMGINFGKNIRVSGKIQIVKYPRSTIKIGSNLISISNVNYYNLNIYNQCKLTTLSKSSKIIIGDNVSFNSINIVSRSQNIFIGSNTMIGGNCQILDSDFHPLWPPQDRSFYPGDEFDKPVYVGNNVFIGFNVIILKGSVIGDNAVIGAGSVVAGSIPSNCLAMGNPAAIHKVFD
jgi:acetyltransferase-like isoleucine patch superfamily enzyme